LALIYNWWLAALAFALGEAITEPALAASCNTLEGLGPPIATFIGDRVLHRRVQSLQKCTPNRGSKVSFEITTHNAYIEFVHDLDHGFIN
jgi:hypothetical protein